MLENEALLKAVLDKPDDDGPRLAYADWCLQQTEEVTRARGEFIKLEIELVRTPYNPLRPPVKAWNRQDRLLNLYRKNWSGGLAEKVADFSFQRGFVEWINVPATVFLERGAEFHARAPVRHADLTGAKPVLEKLAESPHLERLRSLALEGQLLGDTEAGRLAESSRLANLRWLSLANNQIGRLGVEAFCRSKSLPKLVVLGLKNNPCDPRERYGCDDHLITARWMTEEGKSLEAVYGPKPWLHGLGETLEDWFPSRFSLT